MTSRPDSRSAGWWAPLLILALLVLAGATLRGVATAAWWPISTSLADAGPYAYYGANNPFADPQHPAGYPIFLAFGRLFTQDVAVYGIAQHLLTIGGALVLFAAVRRLTGSPWPGVVGAGAVLLGADQIYLERTIMSESITVPVFAVTIYAAARALEVPDRWWPWPVVVGALVVAAGMVRSAGLMLVPVIALALLLARPRPWLPRWRPIAAFIGTAGVLLLGYATVNAIDHDRFEVAPTGGWHLYGRVAPFADCGQFEPPQGTAGLCETTDVNARLGSDHYLYDPDVPAKRVFGDEPWEHDDQLGAFARQVIIHQPRAYAESIFDHVWAYFFPSSFEYKPGAGSDLDGQLDFTGPIYEDVEKGVEEGMEDYFFEPFSVDRDPGALGFLHDYQRIFRFGAAPLTIATLLVLIGLFVGPRRNRIAVLLLGIGGLAIFILPTYSIIYIARYTVPVAGLIMAGAAVSVMSLWPHLRGLWERRSAEEAG